MRASRLWIAATTVLVAAAAFSTSNEVEDRACISATSEEVRALYANYAQVLRQGDVEALTGLYSQDAILMAPGAVSIRLGRTEIADFYTTFLRRRPSVVPLERVVRTDCGIVGATGAEAMSLYMDAGASQPRSFTTRFSLSYARFGDKWLIVHHHQELQDAKPLPDMPSEIASAAARITGANPLPASPTVEIPPSPLELPASAPVILTGQRPLIAGRVVVTVINQAAIDRLSDLARDLMPKPDVSVPRMAYSLGRSVPLIETSPAPGPAAVRVQTQAATVAIANASRARLAAPDAASIVLDLPSALYTLPSLPPTIDPLPSPMPASPVRAEPVQAEPSEQTAPRARTPAAAGSVQRGSPVQTAMPVPSEVSTAAALPKPPRPVSQLKPEPNTKSTPKPKPAALIKPLAKPPAKEPPEKSGKFLRWEERVPVFDD